jgi:ornithine carbamoyltransferase
MSFNLRNRSFVKEIDFEPRELRFLLKLAEALKLAKYAGTEVRRLTGKEIALIFEKTSTRTRSAFEVASYDQGAHVTYLDPSGSQLGHKESVADTAAVLGRMYDAIEFRGNSQSDVEELAAHAGVPVYNGLTNEWHPTQMLADFLTMHESSNKPYDQIAYAYMGDCRFNMGRSLLVTGALMGSDVRLAGPAELHPRTSSISPRTSPGAPAPASPLPRTPRKPSLASTSSTPTYGSRWARPRTCGPNGCGS